MNLNATSWKTTSAGIVMIVGAIVGLVFAFINHNVTEASVMAAVVAVVGGIGLLVAKDSNVTGGTDVSKNNDPAAVKESQKPQ